MGLQSWCLHCCAKLLSQDSLVHHLSSRSCVFWETLSGEVAVVAKWSGSWGKVLPETKMFPMWGSLFPGRCLWDWCLLLTPSPHGHNPRTFEAQKRLRGVNAPHRWYILMMPFSLTSRPAWLRTPWCVLGRWMVRMKQSFSALLFIVLFDFKLPVLPWPVLRIQRQRKVMP